MAPPYQEIRTHEHNQNTTWQTCQCVPHQQRLYIMETFEKGEIVGDTGWIKLHRKITEWEWYQDGNTFRLFVHLLLTANHRPQRWQGITIERGQVAIGRKTLSERTGLSEQSIRTSLGRLKSTSEITIKSTNKFSIITICNYELYQQQEILNQPANQPTSSQQVTTNKNDKNKKKTYSPNSDELRLSDDSVKSIIKNDSKLSSKVMHTKEIKKTTTSSSKISFNPETEKFENLDGNVERWRLAYAGVDILSELQKAGCWIMANPGRAKKNWERFIVNWLCKAHEKALANGKHIQERQRYY